MTLLKDSRNIRVLGNIEGSLYNRAIAFFAGDQFLCAHISWSYCVSRMSQKECDGLFSSPRGSIRGRKRKSPLRNKHGKMEGHAVAFKIWHLTKGQKAAPNRFIGH